MKKLIYLMLCAFLVSASAEAQFLKKLKKKVEQKVENTVTENISNKAANEADKSLNNLWETQLENSSFSMGTERIDPSEIPASYNFDWEYKMNMKTSEGNMDMVYLLKEDASYVGLKVPQAENMITVLDTENDLTVIFMHSKESKIVIATRMDMEATNQQEAQDSYEEMEVEKIGSKTILGYDCQGYKMENDDHVFTFYVTDDAEVSFNDLYKTSSKDLPKGFENAEWMKNRDGLMMEMQMEDKKNPAKSATMTCIGIEKNPVSIKKSDYHGIGG